MKPDPCPTCGKISVLATNFLVPRQETTYKCFGYPLPTDTDYRKELHFCNILDVIRFEPIVDNTEVVHHILIYNTPDYYPKYQLNLYTSLNVSSPFDCESMPPNCSPMFAW